MNACVPAPIQIALAKLKARRLRPALEDIPIPLNCRIDRRWPELMEEMADHIGAYATVQIAETFAGEFIYVPLSVECSPFTDVVGQEAAATLARVFGGERIPIAPMRDAIRHIRICQLIRLVRAKRLKVTEAARIAAIPVRHMSTLVNSDEYVEDYPLIELPEPRELVLLRVAGEIVGQALQESNIPNEVIYAVRDRIMGLAHRVDLPQSEPQQLGEPADKSPCASAL